MHFNSRRIGSVTVSGVLALLAASWLGITIPTNDAGATTPQPATAAAAPTYVWPEFHGDAQLHGTSADPSISSATASTLGVDRMTAIGSSLDSPAVAWDPSLGETLAYAGGTGGYFNAVNVATGQIVWSDYLGAAITASPLVENGNVWIAPAGTGRLDKLDGTTGATECSGTVINSVLSSPVYASPRGGTPTIFVGSLGAGPKTGPVTAYSEADCQQLWQFSDYLQPGQNTGVWAPLSYAVDASGTGLLLFGSANPDSTVYALNAKTGKVVWEYSTYCPPAEDWDVGAGVTTSSPGVNGFADGMAYVEGKDGILFALDLTTGDPVWQFNFGGNSPTNPVTVNTDALSTPALSGSTLVFGDIAGLYGVNAVTGQQQWFTKGTGDINSSPAVVGPPGRRVAAYGDLNGNFKVVRLSNGQVLYDYKTGNVITSSPADVDGNLLVDSEDGFLYDFHLGGGNGSVPSTAITTPAAGADLTNPNGSLYVKGTASAPDGVKAVRVQVQQSGATGPWLHQSAKMLSAGMATASATLADPGETSTEWSLAVPIPVAGGSFQVFASAVGTNGVADTTAYSGVTNAAARSFTVQPGHAASPVSVSPVRTTPESTVQVGAAGFTPGETVTIAVALTSGDSDALATVTADGSGTVPATTVELPASMAFGPDLVTATGSTSGRVDSGTVYVSNTDSQLAYGPGHTGDEPDDSVIAHYQAVSTADKLVQNWSVAGVGGFDTTPAFSAGDAYLGDESGNFYALNMTTGVPLFTESLGSPIESSPAVDGGDVFVGDDAGTLVALNASTGATVWTTSIGGALTSPVVFAGAIYVGSSTGQVAALNESTGATVWSITGAGDVGSAPVVDPATGALVVASHNGTITRLNPANGHAVWTSEPGGIPTGAMISSGRVFVGSSTGSIFALAVSSGATEWSATTGAPITAAPILAYADVTVGNTAGAVSYFNQATGALVNTQAFFGHAITGLTSTDGIVLLTSPWGLGMIEGPHYVRMTWVFPTAVGYTAPGVFLNGDMFVAGSDGLLRGFTIPGRAMA